jgi:glycine/D-amino acid oxidase-like deaminating enzyme
VPDSAGRTQWGLPPWTVEFHPPLCPVPEGADIVVVGGGFSGLTTAAWLRRVDPRKSVVVLEAESLGAGSSRHSGGIALTETAADDLPGLGDVLSGYADTLRELAVDGDLELPGAWEIGRTGGLPDSPISWSDSGELRVVQEVAGGTIHPGKVVSGLARAAHRAGALLIENARVEEIEFGEPLVLHVSGRTLRARHALLATNGQSLELSGLEGLAQPKFTLAIATEPLTPVQMELLGLASRKPFYTVDFPYLWGRLLRDNAAVFGSGLVHLDDWRDLRRLDITTGEPAELLARLERRVRGLHPALRDVQITHRWGGPMLIADRWLPVFTRHPRSAHTLVLGAFSGHGVALSVYLGRWAAEVLLGRRKLPAWQGLIREKER